MPPVKTPRFDAGSFRDRNSRVFYSADAILRGLSPKALEEWTSFKASALFPSFAGEGKIVPTEQVDPAKNAEYAPPGEWAGVLKHERVPFISYPYEWSFGMLKDAALLQLELLLRSIDEGFIVQDASPFNIQWWGARPVFIDIPSFKKLSAGETWVGYRQFCQMFLYPLMLQAYKNVSFQPLLRGAIDGLQPGEISRLLSLTDLLRPGVFAHVFLQSKVQAGLADTKRELAADIAAAGFDKNMIKANARRLQKILEKMKWKPDGSGWVNYADRNTYDDDAREAKQRFIEDVIQLRRWNLVWDIGCNTGIYAKSASKNSNYVLAIDSDQCVIENLYQDLKRETARSILPMVMNLADPSPALGWAGNERMVLQERGQPDLVLCLAVIHHISIACNVPLYELVGWLADLGGDIVIEFVTKEDPMVRKLLLNKDDIYADYELANFERILGEAFQIERTLALASGTRFLYFASSRH